MKKIFLMMVALTSMTFANQLVFWVESPEMVQAYYNIFSAIADIFAAGPAGKDSQFIDLLRLIFLVGGFFVFASGIFNSFGKGGEGAISGYIKYLIIGVAILTLGFYKGGTEIWIMSTTTSGYCTAAGGVATGNPYPAGLYVKGTKTHPDGTTVKYEVPTLLAYAFYFTNKIGLTMTEIAEKAYSTPGMVDLEPQKMSKAGYMGALKGAMKLVAIDPAKVGLRETNPLTGLARDPSTPPYDMGKAYKSMFSDCVLIPFSARGTEGALQIAKLKASSDIHKFLYDWFDPSGANAASTVGGMHPRDLSMTYQGNVYNCGDFYTSVISPIYTQFSSEVACGYGEDIGRGALSLIVGATTGSVSEFNNVAIQAGLVSELEGSLSSLGVGVSGVGYASGKTRAEFIQSSLASGVYMAEMLPYLQMTIRAVLYGFFPFVFVMVLLPGGLKILGTYFQTIVWVELWSPTATIINMFMMSHATNQFSSVYGGSGLTLLSSVDMLSTGSTIAGIGGYLYLSVPALTWLIMKGSAQMLGNLTGAMSAGMARNITTESINRDQELVAKTGEANSRSGKDLSMAEMQHYEAIQGGRMEGAKLGVQIGAGMDTMADIETMNETRKVDSYKLLESSIPGGASGLGAALAANDARDNATKVETGRRVSNGQTLGESTIGAAENNANIEAGSDISKNKNKVTMNEAEGAQNVKQAEIKSDGKVGNSNSVNTMTKANTNKKQFNINEALATDPNLGGLAGKNKMLGIVQENETWKSRAAKFGKDFQKILANAKTENEWKNILEAKERAEYGKKHNMTNEEILDGAAKKTVQKQVTDGAEAKKTEELGTDLNNLGTKNAADIYKDLMATNVYYHNDYSKDNIKKLANDEGLNNVFKLNKEKGNRKKQGGKNYGTTVKAGTKAGEIAGQTTLDTGAGQEGENKTIKEINRKRKLQGLEPISRETFKQMEKIRQAAVEEKIDGMNVKTEFIPEIGKDGKIKSISVSRTKRDVNGNVTTDGLLSNKALKPFIGTTLKTTNILSKGENETEEAFNDRVKNASADIANVVSDSVKYSKTKLNLKTAAITIGAIAAVSLSRLGKNPTIKEQDEVLNSARETYVNMNDEQREKVNSLSLPEREKYLKNIEKDGE